MLRDGQIIFHKNPELRKKFVFTELKKLVTLGNASETPAETLIVESVPVKINKTPLRKLPGTLLQRAGSFFSLF